MLKTELDAPLSPSSRLSRMATPPVRGAADASGKMSLAAARQRSISAARHTQGHSVSPSPTVANRVAEDGASSAPRQRGPASYEGSVTSKEVVPSPQESQSEREITAALGKFEERLAAISTSVEFTEAYVSAGITSKLGEMLAKEVAIAERAALERVKLQRRLRTAGLIIFGLLSLLAAEVRFDFLGDYLSSALAWSETAVHRVLAWSEPVWASLTRWIDTTL